MNELHEFAGTLYGQLVLGLTSGLLSSFVILIFATLFNSSIVPWLQRQFYRGISVSGSWRGEREDGGRVYGFALEIRQSGHVLSGTFSATNRNTDGTQTSKVYKIDGEISNNCVVLKYSPLSNKMYGSGSFVFQVFSAGRELRGGMLFMKTKSGEIKAADDLILSRQND